MKKAPFFLASLFFLAGVPFSVYAFTEHTADINTSGLVDVGGSSAPPCTLSGAGWFWIGTTQGGGEIGNSSGSVGAFCTDQFGDFDLDTWFDGDGGIDYNEIYISVCQGSGCSPATDVWGPYHKTSGEWFEGTGEPPWYEFATSTQIRPGYSPTVGETTGSQTVEFEFDYFINDIQTPPPIYVGFLLENQTTGFTYDVSQAEFQVVSSGASTYISDPDITLPMGDAYRWRPYIKTATSTFIYGYWSPFSVVEQNQAASPFTPIPGGISTTTQASFCDEYAPYDDSDIISATLTYLPNGLCRVVGFLVIPSDASLSAFTNIGTVAQSKAPISWAVEVRGVYDSFVATSSDVFPALALTLGTTSNFLGGGSIELLSEEKVEQFSGSTALSLFRALVATMFWLLAIGFVYRQISGIWHKQVT